MSAGGCGVVSKIYQIYHDAIIIHSSPQRGEAGRGAKCTCNKSIVVQQDEGVNV
jgi:hypothetical protein